MMMNRFINWLGTNEKGQEYMTMLGCSINDVWVIALVGVLCLFVSIQYIDVAWHNYSISRQYEASNVKRYLLFFTGVFVFCLLSGYGYRILSIWWNPYKLLVLLLLVLNIMTYYFRKYMKRTNIVHTIYKQEASFVERLDRALTEIEKQTLESFAGEELKMIPYDDLKTLEEGKKYEVNEGIYFVPLDLNSDVLMFKTIAEKGYFFGMQKHDCWEKVEVRKGVLMSKKNGKPYKEGETLIFAPDKPHNPYCTSEEPADLLVYFSKSKFK